MTAHRGRKAWHIDQTLTVHLGGEPGKKQTLCGLPSPPMIKSYDSRLRVTCKTCAGKTVPPADGPASTGGSAS